MQKCISVKIYVAAYSYFYLSRYTNPKSKAMKDYGRGKNIYFCHIFLYKSPFSKGFPSYIAGMTILIIQSLIVKVIHTNIYL